jgi:hypothetical protein
VAHREARPTIDKGWFTEANRWTQLTFTEDDPAAFDLDRWVEIMGRTQSNGACISAGGYVAYYPTAVPYHYRSAELGERDLFGEVVGAARSLGMRVMARVDPHAIHADAAASNPDWLARASDGTPLEHWAQPGVWLTCAFSPYHREVVTEIAREIVREYDVDAIFANRWEGHGGVSYSESARRSFRDESGLELPAESDVADPAWPEYVAWRRRKLSELVVIWNEAVRSVRSRSHFVPNRGAQLLRDLDREMLSPYYPAFYIDKQGRRDNSEPLWAAGKIGKRSRGSYPDRPVSLITSVGPEHHIHRWKDSVDSAPELQAWIVEGFVHGATPWFTKFSSSIHDDRWLQPVADAFGLHATVEGAFEATTPTADVAVLDALCVDGTDPNPLAAYLAESASEDGFNQALIEARTPFEYLAAEPLSAERLRDFRLLVLPNTEQLSDETCMTIRDFVRAGGAVLADQRSSLAAPGGSARSNFGLADVFGVELGGESRRGERNNYVTFEADHPICAGFDGATRIVGGTEIVPIRCLPGAEAVLRFVPPFPDLPMEEVYPRPGAADPAVVVNRFGAGQAVYVAFDLGEVFWDALLSDHQRLISNIVNWLIGAPRVSVSGNGLVDLAVRESPETSLVSLVNLNSAFAMRGQLRTFDPLGTQVIELRAPSGATTALVRHLIGGASGETRVEGGRVRIEVPQVELLETVRVDWQRG